MSFIPPEIALFSLEEVIRQGITQVSVLPITWTQLQAGIPSLANSPFVADLIVGTAKTEKPDTATQKDSLFRQLFSINDPAERQRMLLAKVQAEAARVLRLPVGKLDVNRCLNQFGMDSLMALELKNRMQAELRIAIPLGTVLSGPSVTDLSNLLLEKLASDSEVLKPESGDDNLESSSAAIDSQEAQELLRKLPDLSDEAVDSILSRMVANQSGRDRQE